MENNAQLVAVDKLVNEVRDQDNYSFNDLRAKMQQKCVEMHERHERNHMFKDW